MQKLFWGDLTKQEQDSIPNQAGSGWSSFAPEFIFTAFNRHDFEYARGGGIKDKFFADFHMLGDMLFDACMQEKLYAQFYYTLIAFGYFLIVWVFGCLYFRFGNYRSKTEILNELIK